MTAELFGALTRYGVVLSRARAVVETVAITGVYVTSSARVAELTLTYETTSMIGHGGTSATAITERFVTVSSAKVLTRGSVHVAVVFGWIDFGVAVVKLTPGASISRSTLTSRRGHDCVRVDVKVILIIETVVTNAIMKTIVLTDGSLAQCALKSRFTLTKRLLGLIVLPADALVLTLTNQLLILFATRHILTHVAVISSGTLTLTCATSLSTTVQTLVIIFISRCA